MENLYKKYCTEEFDEQGILTKFDVHYDDNFNFAYDVIDEIAKNEPNRRAMVWTDESGDEKVFTFGDMSRYSNKTANFFVKNGVKKGDKVLLLLKRHYEFWFCILALHKIGAIAIPATIQLTTKDIVYRAKSANIKAIICTATCDKLSDFVDIAQTKCDEIKIKVLVRAHKDGWLNFADGIENESDEFKRVETHATDDMLMFFTSGTTGNPKMVMHDYTYPLGHIVTAKYWHTCDPNGLHLTVADTGWAKASWGKIYGQWFMGAGLFTYDFDKFKPLDLLAHIEKYKISTFCAPPTVFRFFIKEGMSTYDLSSLQHVTTAGEALNNEVYNKFKEVTGLDIMEGFGQSETSMLIGNLVGTSPRSGSMGKPSPLFDIDIVDEFGASVEDGIVGEIVVRPPQNKKQVGLFTQYYKDEEKTKDCWRFGVYHTGDTAYKDEDGYLWYVGRNDDIIKASGYRIGPFEVESVLMEHPAVLECAVTGAPDPIRGQVVKATIVLTSQYSPSDELKKDIQNFVKKTTAPYKYPRIVEFVTELPKTVTGKIKRIDIRNQDKN
ncbi:MAG: AMP-binding protein [Oscillospiraceae bacterium]